MISYLVVKTIHVISAALLFGTGLGTAFFMWFTHRTGNITAIATVARLTVIADWVLTAPAVVAQPVTGFWLLHLARLDWRTAWVQGALCLYLLAGGCWLSVVFLQMRARDLAVQASRDATPLPPSYYRCMHLWFALGWPAFLALLLVFWLMVAKPVLWN